MGMKIALGTVQFGLTYGAFNRDGQVSQDDVQAILALAQDAGIDTLDTAHAYGSSEAVLGDQQAGERFRIVTKIPALAGSDAAVHVPKLFSQSLERLRIKQVHGLLLHRAADLLDAGADAVWQAMQALREQGRVRCIGFSAYGPEEALQVLHHFPVELIQLPLSVFDTRHRDAGVLALCRSRGIEVHVRSVFLQGFALAEPGTLAGHLAQYRAVLAGFRARCTAHGLTPLQAALRYALDLPEVAKVVVGVNGRAQLDEILRAVGGEAAAAEFFEGLSCGDLNLIDPSRWTGTKEFSQQMGRTQ